MSNLINTQQFEKYFNNEFTNYNIILYEIENLYNSHRLDEKNENITQELSNNNSNLIQSQSRLFSLQNNLENATIQKIKNNDIMID